MIYCLEEHQQMFKKKYGIVVSKEQIKVWLDEIAQEKAATPRRSENE